MHRPFVSTVNSLFQPSVGSTPVLSHTYKKSPCRAACRFLHEDPDADAEVCAVKQG